MNEKTVQKRAEALRMRLDGMTYAAIGAALSLSRQRIQQLTRPPLHIYKEVVERAAGRCQSCGLILVEGQVHHKRDMTDPEVFNSSAGLSYLCVTCHRRRHRPRKAEVTP